MQKINIINFMSSDKHVIDFLTKHAMVDLTKRENLVGVGVSESEYFHNIIDIVDNGIDCDSPYIVIKFRTKFYRLCGHYNYPHIIWDDWCEVKIIGAEIKYTWDVL